MNDNEILKPVNPEELSARWPALRAPIEQMLQDADEGEIPEQLYADIQCGNSYLWALDDDKGFVVLETHPTRTGRVLFVVMGWNESDPSARVYLEQIKGIAAENHCARIRWVSGRRWERHLEEATVRFVYEINVEGSG